MVRKAKKKQNNNKHYLFGFVGVINNNVHKVILFFLKLIGMFNLSLKYKK